MPIYPPSPLQQPQPPMGGMQRMQTSAPPPWAADRQSQFVTKPPPAMIGPPVQSGPPTYSGSVSTSAAGSARVLPRVKEAPPKPPPTTAKNSIRNINSTAPGGDADKPLPQPAPPQPNFSFNEPKPELKGDAPPQEGGGDAPAPDQPTGSTEPPVKDGDVPPLGSYPGQSPSKPLTPIGTQPGSQQPPWMQQPGGWGGWGQMPWGGMGQMPWWGGSGYYNPWGGMGGGWGVGGGQFPGGWGGMTGWPWGGGGMYPGGYGGGGGWSNYGGMFPGGWGGMTGQNPQPNQGGGQLPPATIGNPSPSNGWSWW